MRGTIQARGKGTWRLRVDAGTDPVSGRRKVISETVHGAKRDAERRLAALVAAQGGRRYSDTTTTFGALYEAWLDQIRPTASPLTVQRYEQAARLHLLPTLEARPLDTLGPYDLDRIYARMQADGQKAASVRKVHQVASSVFGQAVKWKWLNDNPANDASPPKTPRPNQAAPTPEVVARVFRTVAETDPAFAFFLHLAAWTGCRRGELCALRWSDFDPEAGTLTVARAVISVKGGHVLEKETKTGTARRMNLPPTTVANFATHRLRTAEALLKVGATLGPADFVFNAGRSMRTDRPTRPDLWTHRWIRLRAKADAEGVRLHDLRHHAATELISLGVDVRTVMQRLGWTTLGTAMRYIHDREEADRRAADVLERALQA